MKTTLIITVYNRKEHLRKALISLGSQSVLPDELVISDDGSSEDIPSAISDIVKGFSFPVKFVTQKHKGFRLAKTRNNGVRVSSGELLVFLDQDLIHTRNVLKLFIENARSKRFLTGMPIWLSEEKSELVTEDVVKNYEYLDFIDDDDLEYIERQYRKDKIYYWLHKFRLTNQPRLRGGFCAINRVDFEKINGYDERFIGWGAEDDDLGRMLYKSGVAGFNPFQRDFTIHLWHEKSIITNAGVKEQANYEYYQQKKKEIAKGNYRTEYGLDNPFEENDYETFDLN